MCGIFASFNNILSEKQIKFILNNLYHRGPDACEIYIFNELLCVKKLFL